MRVRNISKKPVFIGTKTYVMQNDEIAVPKAYVGSPALEALIDAGYLIEVPDIVKPGRERRTSKPAETKVPDTKAADEQHTDAHKDGGKNNASNKE